MQQFYFLRDSLLPEHIGVFPQVEKLHDGFHTQNRFALWLDPPANQLPQAKGIKLKHRAKLTDFIIPIQYGTNAALISIKLFELLSSIPAKPWLEADAEVSLKGKIYPYKFLYFPKGQEEYRDFAHTVFFRYANATAPLENITLQNPEELRAFWEDCQRFNKEVSSRGEKTGAFGVQKVAIRPDAPDFFVLKYQPDRFVISERFKQAMEEAGITGVLFLPVSEYEPSRMRLEDRKKVIS